MCFNKELSLGFSLTNIILSAWVMTGNGFWGKLESWQRRNISLCLFYFSLMEGLQFFQYLVIDQCGTIINELLTGLGWVHICWQPLFSNFAFSAVDPKNHKQGRQELWSFVFKFSFVSGFLMLLRYILPYFIESNESSAFFKPCLEAFEGVCSNDTCTRTGIYHLAWTFKMLRPNYFLPAISAHCLFMFIAPFILGLRWQSLLLFLSGPGIAVCFLFNAKNMSDGELSAIWCFFSVMESILTIFCSLFACRQQIKNNENKKIK